MRSDDSGLPPHIEATVVTVGTFDGMHRGHQDVLARLVARSKATGRPSLLVTFDPHPLEVVNPAAAPHLLTVGVEKLEVLVESGVDYAAVVPFTPELAGFDAATFVDVVLRRRFRMSELLMGYDHGFGRGRAGDVETLRQIGARDGFAVEVIPAVETGDGHAISSTFIRRAIAGGDLARAAHGLGRDYGIAGRVVPGAQRGRDLGFRTLNLSLPSARKLLPPAGVYAVLVQTPAGPFGGMMNLGPRPTFGEDVVTLEAHLFDADVDLYGQMVRVDVVRWLRATQAFTGPAALVAQLQQDERDARAVLAAR